VFGLWWVILIGGCRSINHGSVERLVEWVDGGISFCMVSVCLISSFSHCERSSGVASSLSSINQHWRDTRVKSKKEYSSSTYYSIGRSSDTSFIPGRGFNMVTAMRWSLILLFMVWSCRSCGYSQAVRHLFSGREKYLSSCNNATLLGSSTSCPLTSFTLLPSISAIVDGLKIDVHQ